MEINKILDYICCPKCHSRLNIENESLSCSQCENVYPVIFGIPDFRLDVDPQFRQKEREDAEELIDLFEQSSFEELMRFYVKKTTSDDLLELDLDYELDWSARAKKQLFKINVLAKKLNDAPISDDYIKGLYVDIGCGKGAMIGEMSKYCETGLALDHSLVYLILAKKLIEQNASENVFLMVASNMALPIKNSAAEFITSIDVIEHVEDQKKSIDEDMRILNDHKCLFLNSPNRYSLFGLEDHVQLWGVGLIPRRFVKKYVKFFSGHAYEGVWLLSYWKLKKLINRHSNVNVIEGILFDNKNKNMSLKEKIFTKVPGLLFVFNRVFKYFIPSYQLLLRKN